MSEVDGGRICYSDMFIQCIPSDVLDSSNLKSILLSQAIVGQEHRQYIFIGMDGNTDLIVSVQSPLSSM